MTLELSLSTYGAPRCKVVEVTVTLEPKMRHFGIIVNSNPYDPVAPLGIDHDSFFVPFATEGSTVFFESCVLSNEELEKCPHVVLTDGDTEWDPNAIKMSR